MNWQWIFDHTAEIQSRFIEHIELTVVAVAIGFVVSFPLGVFAYRHKWFYGPVAGFTGLLYTLPSLALFAFLTPITGLSFLTAEIGLVSYTLLILIRNIVAGLRSVPDDVREAARGMGFSDWELLWKVEIPLALPVIVAGIRLATVTTIGLVTVTALITLGGLGYFILLGINRLFPTAAVLGSVLSLVLAIVVDAILVWVERSITPWTRATVAR